MASIPGDNAGVANTVWQAAMAIVSRFGGRSESQGSTNAELGGYGPLFFNPAAFCTPSGLTFGNAGRNILNNPCRTNFDMSLIKHFAITESKYFEFRGEAFNVFNHTEWAWLGGDAGSAASDNANGSGVTGANSVGCYGGANNSAGDASCTGTAAFSTPTQRTTPASCNWL